MDFFSVNREDRIAQLVFQAVAKVHLERVDYLLVETARGAGGFGHTGIQK